MPKGIFHWNKVDPCPILTCELHPFGCVLSEFLYNISFLRVKVKLKNEITELNFSVISNLLIIKEEEIH